MVSHRGFWVDPIEKNTSVAFERSLRHGFGIETDVRDVIGALVISHDPPDVNAQTLDDFLHLYNDYEMPTPLALNIKSDGLQDLLGQAISKSGIQNYFVFDMAIPDMVGYLKNGMKAFTRHSDLEQNPVCYGECAGVWMDTMRKEWITRNSVREHLEAGKQVCIVSPELHARPHEPFWTLLRDWSLASEPDLMICTDHPRAAAEFFSG